MEYFWLGLVYAYSKCHVCSGANKAKFLFFYFFRQLTFVSGIVSWISWFRIWSQSNEVTKNQSMHGLGTAHRNWSKYFFIVKFRHFFFCSGFNNTNFLYFEFPAALYHFEHKVLPKEIKCKVQYWALPKKFLKW